MTVEVPKTVCQKCSDGKCDQCSNPENCWCERYKHEIPEVNCPNCKDSKCDKCQYPDRCRCAYYKHGDNFRIGVIVDKSKSDNEKSRKEFDDVNRNLKSDQELKHELRLLWQIVRSYDVEFDEKQKARKRMDELHLTLGIKKKVWLPEEKQKEFDEAWQIMGLENGKGVKEQKADAKIIINKLRDELGEDPYFDLEFDASWLGYAKLIMNEERFLTLEDSDEIICYSKGKYYDGGEKLAKKILFDFYPNLDTKYIKEVVARIKTSTWIPRKEFDINQDEFCLENKIINMRTGEISEHSYKKLFRVQLPIKYDKDAKCPKFIKFMQQCLPNPYDYIVVMEEFASCLLKNTLSFQEMYFYTGNGDNGKSVFIHIIEWFLGEGLYSSEKFHKLIKDRFAVANLEDKLANVYADIASDTIDNINEMKPIVSGDTINAEFKHKTAHPFRNFAKMFFSANELPTIEEKTFSALKRIMLTKWEQIFKEKKEYQKELENLSTIYPELEHELLKKELTKNGVHLMDKQFFVTFTSDENERRGILNILLIICKNMIRRGGFFHKQDMEDLKDMWSENSTAIEKYVNECVVENPSEFIEKGRMHTLYTKYSIEITGKPPRANNVFHKQVKKLLNVEEGFKRIHGVERRVYFGISWNFDNSFIRKYERMIKKISGKDKKSDQNNELLF